MRLKKIELIQVENRMADTRGQEKKKVGGDEERLLNKNQIVVR